MLKKKVQSRPRPAKARSPSTSRVARSGNSVGGKSKKSTSKSEKLRVATPQNSGFALLIESGILVPEELHANEEEVPLDFTGSSSKEIGSIHSRFAVRHAHALFVLAKVAVELAHLKRDLRLEQAQFRFRHKGEHKTKYELDDAMAESKRHKSISNKILEAEANYEILQAVVQGYEDLRNAASREIARRTGEQAPRD